MGLFRRVSVSILSLLEVALAVAIIVVVAVQLTDYSSIEDGTISCVLGTSVDSSSLCSYTYAVAGLSLLASMVMAILACYTCNFCGCGDLFYLLFAAAACAWWIIGASVITSNATKSNGDVKQGWRDFVYISAWIEAAMFGLQSVLYMFGFCCCK